MAVFTLANTLGVDGFPNIVLAASTTITAQWVDTQVRCGDTAKLSATITPAPPDGTTAQIDVFVDGGGAPSKTSPTSSVLFTVPVSIKSGAINAEWNAKAATSSWRTDKMRFRVTLTGAGNQKADSTNTLTFIDRSTVGFTAVHNFNEVGGAMKAVENHDAALEADRVHYRLNISEVAAPVMAASGPVLTDLAKTAMSSIAPIWTNGFKKKSFHRVNCQRGDSCDCTFDCCKVTFSMDVNIVTSGQHVAVTFHARTSAGVVFRASTSDTTGDWADPPKNSWEYAHEIGHILGQFDEYVGGVKDPSGLQPQPAPEISLMADSGPALLVRHYRWALRFLNSNTGADTYKTVQQ